MLASMLNTIVKVKVGLPASRSTAKEAVGVDKWATNQITSAPTQRDRRASFILIRNATLYLLMMNSPDQVSSPRPSLGQS